MPCTQTYPPHPIASSNPTCHSPFAAKGGFGEVWRAEWDGLEYAVKIFRSTLYSHWGREGEIYKTCMLTHPNILQFISMDSDDNSSKCMCKVKVTLYFRFTSTSLPFLSTPPNTSLTSAPPLYASLSSYTFPLSYTCTPYPSPLLYTSTPSLHPIYPLFPHVPIPLCIPFFSLSHSTPPIYHTTTPTDYGIDYWLIFTFHHNGSLSSYLTNHALTQDCGFRFLSSIAAGLSYLHRPILTSTQDCKPTVAHRDLKPGNILIKNDMSCCIGDLGLAVTEYDFRRGKELPNPFQGTKRYMAPEVLSKTIKTTSIHSYVMADVYAFSLIMWEVLRRCQTHGEWAGGYLGLWVWFLGLWVGGFRIGGWGSSRCQGNRVVGVCMMFELAN